MSYTVITTNRDGQAAVVVTSRLDVLSIAKAADKHPDEAVTVFAQDVEDGVQNVALRPTRRAAARRRLRH